MPYNKQETPQTICFQYYLNCSNAGKDDIQIVKTQAFRPGMSKEGTEVCEYTLALEKKPTFRII